MMPTTYTLILTLLLGHGTLFATKQSRYQNRNSSEKFRTLLMVDDQHVLYRSGTQRFLRPLDRYSVNALLATDKPWEKTIAYCSVYRNPETGNYQLWYQAWGYLCYAISRDGIHWVKPNLGLHSYEDSLETNILMKIGFGAGVIVDLEEPNPQRRYKFAYWHWSPIGANIHHGTCVAFSPDGIHWTKYPQCPLIKGSHGVYIQPPLAGDPRIETGKLWGPPLSTSDVTDPIWDPSRKSFAIYSKTWIDGPDGTMHWKRSVVRTDSQDFIHWSRPQLVMYPDEHDGWTSDSNELNRTAGGGGSDGKQIHSAPAFYYNGMYFATLQVLDSGQTGNMPLELALSHDGFNWQRPFRDTLFLPSLPDKSRFDASIIWSNSTPVFLKEEFRYYYGAYGQQWNIDDDRKQNSGIGLATMPPDRFAGIQPIGTIGQITLKPIQLNGSNSITINSDTSGGSLRVEILNKNGYRLKGFTKEDAIPLLGNNLKHPVSWQKQSITNLDTGEYMLRLHLKDSQVFALTIWTQ